jgi:hypothetical protein
MQSSVTTRTDQTLEVMRIADMEKRQGSDGRRKLSMGLA